MITDFQWRAEQSEAERGQEGLHLALQLQGQLQRQLLTSRCTTATTGSWLNDATH
ncbi:hypothetical protein [Kineococcus aurantiacus]|uniref:Uncharacterized protein n=1 Tax=Kineococcus aurantiacus TaxID=37633 RepID=A0A7Y9J360_9ACTN|nr:hypothetical protein [Kineococcus aurantiacus]NYD24698.1 hypothetical protein [Kineococcus aurantiacus]